jgi:hypothetical protein
MNATSVLPPAASWTPAESLQLSSSNPREELNSQQTPVESKENTYDSPRQFANIQLGEHIIVECVSFFLPERREPVPQCDRCRLGADIYEK